MSKILGFKII